MRDGDEQEDGAPVEVLRIDEGAFRLEGHLDRPAEQQRHQREGRQHLRALRHHETRQRAEADQGVGQLDDEQARHRVRAERRAVARREVAEEPQLRQALAGHEERPEGPHRGQQEHRRRVGGDGVPADRDPDRIREGLGDRVEVRPVLEPERREVVHEPGDEQDGRAAEHGGGQEPPRDAERQERDDGRQGEEGRDADAAGRDGPVPLRRMPRVERRVQDLVHGVVDRRHQAGDDEGQEDRAHVRRAGVGPVRGQGQEAPDRHDEVLDPVVEAEGPEVLEPRGRRDRPGRRTGGRGIRLGAVDHSGLPHHAGPRTARAPRPFTLQSLAPGSGFDPSIDAASAGGTPARGASPAVPTGRSGARAGPASAGRRGRVAMIHTSASSPSP